MHKPSVALAILVLGCVAACAAIKQPTTGGLGEEASAQSSDAETAAFNTALEVLRSSCEAKMRDPALNAIRHKIELMRDIPAAGDNGPPPLSIVMNNAKPTGEEEAAIEKWAKIYEECIRQGYRIGEAWSTPELTYVEHQIDQKITTLSPH
jgi:hypothetical protein